MNNLDFHLSNPGQIIHLGSKTKSIYTPLGDNADYSFSFELRHISLTNPGDIIILRKNKVPWDYIKYHESLIKGKIIIIEVNENPNNADLSLPQLLLNSVNTIQKIKSLIKKNAVLMVWDSTNIEQKIAELLDIPLWGSSKINYNFGHKSGARILGINCNLNIPKGKSCKTIIEVFEYLNILKKEKINKVIIKFDESYGGIGHKIINNINQINNQEIEEFLHSTKQNLGQGWTVEEWISSVKTIGSHIEITPNKKYSISYLWEQIIDKDGVSYNGAIPLKVEKKYLFLFKNYLNKICRFIIKQGGQGSFGPDFMIGKNGKIYFNELNARIPSTAFPLNIVKETLGHIPDGFLATSIKTKRVYEFNDLKKILEYNNLIYPNSKKEGVIPYHIGQLNWKNLYIAIVSNSQVNSKLYLNKLKKIC